MHSRTSGKPGVNIEPGSLYGKKVSEVVVDSSGNERLDTDVRRLLVPIKNAKDISYGVRYARCLQDKGTSVKVCLLHVVDAASGVGMSYSPAGGGDTAVDGRVRSLIADASALLNESRIRFDCHIRQGDAVFIIFDSAELFDCHEIVLPESRRPFLSRIFSDSVARKLMRSRRSVPVVMVNSYGQICASSFDTGLGGNRLDPIDEPGYSGFAARRSI